MTEWANERLASPLYCTSISVYVLFYVFRNIFNSAGYTEEKALTWGLPTPGRLLNPVKNSFLFHYFLLIWYLWFFFYKIILKYCFTSGNGCGCVPVKPYLPKAVTGRIWLSGCGLLIPGGGKRDTIRKIVITFILGSRRRKLQNIIFGERQPSFLGKS